MDVVCAPTSTDIATARVARRLEWYPRLLLSALALAFVYVLATADGSATTTGRLGGDYPAFHAAGTIALDGAYDDVYDPQVQAAAQGDLLGGEDGFLAFAYSPHVAAAYAPLATLPYGLAYALHTAVMVAALVTALHLLRPIVRVVDRWFSLVVAGAIAFFPIFRALGGGQNTAVTVLLLAVVWVGLHRSTVTGELMAGGAAGLLLFRPQYAIPLIALLALARHRAAVGAATIVAAATWVVNAALLGPGWVGEWLDQVGPFVETDADVNAANAVSWLGFGEAVLGPGHVVAVALGVALAAATAVALSMVWWRADRFDVASRMAITAPGLVLISPHAMFYEAGVLVITAVVALDRKWVSPATIGVLWLAAIAHVAKNALGVTPVAVILMIGFVFAAQRILASAGNRTTPPPRSVRDSPSFRVSIPHKSGPDSPTGRPSRLRRRATLEEGARDERPNRGSAHERPQGANSQQQR